MPSTANNINGKPINISNMISIMLPPMFGISLLYILTYTHALCA